MKILISTQGEGGLEDVVSQVFARAPTFTLVEIEDKEIKKVEVFKNEAASAFGGAGIQAAQFAASKGANVVITGSIGPNAADMLLKVKIKVVTGFGGLKVKEAIKKFLEAEASNEATFSSPLGVGRGFGRAGMGGPIGECVCTNCGYRMPKPAGVPCRSLRCPKCGSIMVKVV